MKQFERILIISNSGAGKTWLGSALSQSKKIPLFHMDNTIMRIQSGPFGEDLVESMPKVIKTLADDDHNHIVDEVLFEDLSLQHYANALRNHTVYFIAITCELNVMEEREILGGDRALGLARDQILRFHGPTRFYDLTVDSTHVSAFDCARNIMEFLN